MSILRGRATNADTQYNMLGFFNLTLPGDYNAGDDITLTVGGSSVVPGVFPSPTSFGVSFSFVQLDDSFINEGPYSGTGFSYDAGSNVKIWTSALPLGGTGNLPLETEFTLPIVIYRAADMVMTEGTLIDAGPIGHSGEGYFAALPYFPIGWVLGVWNDTGSVASLPDFQPGDEITVVILMGQTSSDGGNPTAEFYGYLTDLEVDFGGITTPQVIPIEDIQVGFNDGLAGGVAWPFDANPLREVEVDVVPALSRNYQDFYLSETVPPPPEPAVEVGQVITVNCSQILVTGFDSESGVYSGEVIVGELPTSLGDDAPAPIAPGDWTVRTPVQVVSGLEHLEGKEVMALGDGLVLGPFTVTAGEVDLGAEYAQVVVGLDYAQQIKTLYLTAEGIQAGSEQGKRKFLPDVTLRVECTRGLSVGPAFDRMHEVSGLIQRPTTLDLVTGDVYARMGLGWDDKGEVCIEQNYPLPATINGVIVGVVAGDTQR